jgi:hypothetical protein
MKFKTFEYLPSDSFGLPRNSVCPGCLSSEKNTYTNGTGRGDPSIRWGVEEIVGDFISPSFATAWQLSSEQRLSTSQSFLSSEQPPSDEHIPVSIDQPDHSV